MRPYSCIASVFPDLIVGDVKSYGVLVINMGGELAPEAVKFLAPSKTLSSNLWAKTVEPTETKESRIRLL